MSATGSARVRTQARDALRQPSVSRASRSQHTGAPTIIDRLQRDLGNRGMHRLLHSGVIQTKLTIGPADDEYRA